MDKTHYIRQFIALGYGEPQAIATVEKIAYLAATEIEVCGLHGDGYAFLLKDAMRHLGMSEYPSFNSYEETCATIRWILGPDYPQAAEAHILKLDAKREKWSQFTQQNIVYALSHAVLLSLITRQEYDRDLGKPQAGKARRKLKEKRGQGFDPRKQ
jgi:hypothetical protein